MDTSAVDITFDSSGVCNYCTTFFQRNELSFSSSDNSSFVYASGLDQLLFQIKRKFRRKRYDCIIGISGGVDSSWTLVKALELGLRPLAVHMDNGWNSELAQSNISNLVTNLGVDLFTYVVDWDEYKSLMQAFFDADVIDIELLYDNAMLAVCYNQARKYGLKYILSGSNQATEGLTMPKSWNWYKRDVINIRSIYKTFQRKSIKFLPTHSTLNYFIDELLLGIHWISFLDYIPYNKALALNDLTANFDYKPYPYKHYESVFTRFYQGYILPQKFAIDKRLVHYSSLVLTDQISYSDALKVLDSSPYVDQQSLNSDIAYFLKKMDWSVDNLNSYLARPRVEHSDYPSELPFFNFFFRLLSPNVKLFLKRILYK